MRAAASEHHGALGQLLLDLGPQLAQVILEILGGPNRRRWRRHPDCAWLDEPCGLFASLHDPRREKVDPVFPIAWSGGFKGREELARRLQTHRRVGLEGGCRQDRDPLRRLEARPEIVGLEGSNRGTPRTFIPFEGGGVASAESHGQPARKRPHGVRVLEQPSIRIDRTSLVRDFAFLLAIVGVAQERIELGPTDETRGPVDNAAPNGPADPAAEPDAAQWYRANGLRFYERLKPTAQKALATIVAEGPTVPIDEVIAATGLRGPSLAGSLASIGSAVRGLGAPAAPFSVDHKRRTYAVDPAVLVALRAVLPADGA
jgi:hypothetical protein